MSIKRRCGALCTVERLGIKLCNCGIVGLLTGSDDERQEGEGQEEEGLSPLLALCACRMRRGISVASTMLQTAPQSLGADLPTGVQEGSGFFSYDSN